MAIKFNKLGVRRASLASSIAMLGALASQQAMAQDDTTTANDSSDVEEIVVLGIKESLMNAQDLKRDATTVIDVITASDIGNLPDKSVVDALSRMPGVSIEVFEATDDPEHFGAEGSTALVRGLNRTLTQFNGRTSFSATKWGALNLSHIPAELVGAIEVSKNQTAEMIEGGIAGTLNLVTRKAFDNDGLTFGGSIKGTYADLSDTWAPDLSGLFSNRWDTDIGEIGFLASLSLSEYKAQSQGVGVHDMYERSDRRNPDGSEIPGVGEPLAGAEDRMLFLPPSIQARIKDDERERIGFATSLQFSNTDETFLATLEFIRSDATLTWGENLMQNKDSLGRQLGNRNVSSLLEVPGLSGVNQSFDSNGLFTHGFISGAGYEAQARYHKEESFVNDWSLDLEFNVTDNLTVKTDLQYVDSEQVMYDHTIHNQFESDVWADLRDSDNPQVGFVGDNYGLQEDGSWSGDTGSITNKESIVLRSGMDHETNSVGDALALAVDAEYTFDDSWVTSIKGGVRFSDREQLHKETNYQWGLVSAEWTDTKRLASDYPQFHEEIDFGSDFHGGGFSNGLSKFHFPKMSWSKDLWGFEDAIHSTLPDGCEVIIVGDPECDFVNHTNTDFVTFRRAEAEGKEPGTAFAPNTIFEVTEKRSAAYVQMDFEFDDLAMPIRGNMGFRYVDIDVTSSGHITFDEPSGTYTQVERYTEDTVVDLPSDLLQFLTNTSRTDAIHPERFTDVLPSLNLSMNVREDLLFRFAASKAIYTPHLSTLRNSLIMGESVETVAVDPDDDASPFESVTFQNYTGESVGGSNPYLVPEESINMDFSVEWYFADVGSVTGVIFLKDMDNLIRTASTRENITNPETGVTNEIIMTNADSNVGKAKIKGYELAYQQTFDMLPGFWSGLGMQANYTHLSTSEDVGSEVDTTIFGAFTNLPIEGLSPDTYNLIGFYENERFNTRLAYNFRSEYMLDDRDVIADRPVYNADRGVLDFSFTYNINDNVRVGFDANNLLDEQTRTQLQYNQEGNLSPRNYFVNDRRYSLRLSASY